MIDITYYIISIWLIFGCLISSIISNLIFWHFGKKDIKEYIKK